MKPACLLLCLILRPGVGPVQEVPSGSVHVLGPTQCQVYGAALDVLAQNAPDGRPITVIARLGEGETNSELNKRRLHNVRVYWTEFRSDKVPAESVILATGERVKDHGRLEIFVGGKLALILKIKGNRDLIVGNCYPEPLEAPLCNAKENRNFYPCLDRNIRRKRS